MARQLTASDLQDKFLLRMPDGLRDRIAAAAKANGRSMNSEIVSVLEEAFPAPSEGEEIWELFEKLTHSDRAKVVETIKALRDPSPKKRA